MRQRLGLCSTIPALVSMAMMAILGLLATAPEPVRADLYCTQFGSSTFRVGSTVKFQWNDTQSVEISSFNLDLYCVQNNQLVTTLMPLNLSSPAVVSWVVDQSFTTLTTNCSAMVSLNHTHLTLPEEGKGRWVPFVRSLSLEVSGSLVR